MFKRVRWTTFGYMAGVGTSYAVARKVKREVTKLGPQQVTDRVKAAVADGRTAMREREHQLRREYDPRSLRAVPNARARGR